VYQGPWSRGPVLSWNNDWISFTRQFHFKIKSRSSSQRPIGDSIPTREFNFRGLAKCIDYNKILNWNAWLSPNWMRSFRLSFVYWTDWKLMFVSKCRNYSNLKAKIGETFISLSRKASPEGDHDSLDLQFLIHVFYTLLIWICEPSNRRGQTKN